MDTGAGGGDEGYAKSAGSPSAGNAAPYWAEGSPMNRGSSMQQFEENKIQGSRRQEDCTKLSNSSDRTGTRRRDVDTSSSSCYGRSRSREDEARIEDRKKSTEQHDYKSRHRSGPVTRWMDTTIFKATERPSIPFCNTFEILGLYQSTWRGRKSQQQRRTRCQSRLLNEEGGLSLVDGETARRGRCR